MEVQQASVSLEYIHSKQTIRKPTACVAFLSCLAPTVPYHSSTLLKQRGRSCHEFNTGGVGEGGSI